MVMSQALMSASAIGRPRLGDSAEACSAASTTTRPAARSLRIDRLSIDMLDLPVSFDPPAGNRIVVLVGESDHVRDGLGLPARAHELRPCRLKIAGLIEGSALQDRRLTVPSPWHAKAGECHGQPRLLQRPLAPAGAAVGGNHHLGDSAGAGIGNAGNLV